jgi:hypothetical protein
MKEKVVMRETLSARPVVEVVCPDCDGVSRREFLRAVGGTVAAGAAFSAVPALPALAAEETPGRTPETVVKQFYETLTEKQRRIIVFPWDHKLRSHVSNNWNVLEEAHGEGAGTEGSIGNLYTKDQQELIREILRGVTTEDGFERYMRQMKDDHGGLENYACAVFGKPGDGKFEWLLTGRHVTLRVDGNSIENTAFGGPIFYGHAVTFNEEPDHPGNVWWHQGKLANEVFKSLDGKQREKALLDGSPADSAESITLKGQGAEIPGIPGSELSTDQKNMLHETLKSLLSMYRKSDVDEALDCIKANGGLDSLRLAFYKGGDLGEDGVWDRWRVEGPTFVWYFRGSPHVHVWVNLAHRTGAGPSAKTARV